jgi:hypothetical protein
VSQVTIEEALGAAVLVALEGLCFVSADGFAPAPTTDEPTTTKAVTFRGRTSGVVAITIPKPLLATLFGDILDEVDVRACLDALGELTNIVCGKFVPRAYGMSVYELGAPVTEEQLPPPSVQVVVRVGTRWVRASLHPEVGS